MNGTQDTPIRVTRSRRGINTPGSSHSAANGALGVAGSPESQVSVSQGASTRSTIEIRLPRRSLRGRETPSTAEDSVNLPSQSPVIMISSDDEEPVRGSSHRFGARSANGTTSKRPKYLQRDDLSLNSNKMDLEEEEDDSIVYTDFIVAQRLQAEEYAQATNGSLLEPPAKRARTEWSRSLLSAFRSGKSTGSGAGLPNSLNGRAKNGLGESAPIPAPSRVPEVTITGGTRAAQASDFISASQLLQQDKVGLGLPSDFSTGVSSSDVTDASDGTSDGEEDDDDEELESESDEVTRRVALAARDRRAFGRRTTARAVRTVRQRLESFHPELPNLWINLENEPPIIPVQAEQPPTIHRRMKGFQLEGLSWMKQMEESKYKGGILGDEMGLGKTIQAVSLIMSDFPVGKPSLVLVPPVALLQWVSEIDSYTDKTLKTFVYHATNAETKALKLNELKKYDVIIMSYNSLESMYRRETKGHKKKRKGDACTVEVHKKPSIIHKIDFHRLILDEAHEIKVRRRSSQEAGSITSHHLY